jgi:L-malate glycosyltransferase
MTKRILLLADVNSPHTQKLVEGIAASGYETGVFSLSARKKEWFGGKPRITIFDEDAVPTEVFSGSSLRKLGYLRKVKAVKKAIREFKPDIVHAHYATSYGLLGWRCGFHPLVISAWGSDVMDFSASGAVKKALVKKVLNAADLLMATSLTLEKAVMEICGKHAVVTPFGVDTNIFRKEEVAGPFADAIVIGTVKSLEPVYGIDTLIKAFRIVKQRNPGKKFHLLIVGEGTQREELTALAKTNGLKNEVTFTGRIDRAEIARYHNMIGIFVNLSRYESFGVSVLEAMACENPVVVSDTGGLAEIVDEGKTGFRVKVNDPEAAAAAIEKLLDEKLCVAMGKNAREKVKHEFEWNATVKLIVEEYRKFESRT